jgi:hypothetical protein
MADTVVINEVDDWTGWYIARGAHGDYGVHDADGIRVAQVHWDSDGYCWLRWESPAVDRAYNGSHLDSLEHLLGTTEKPDDVKPRDPWSE